FTKSSNANDNISYVIFNLGESYKMNECIDFVNYHTNFQNSNIGKKIKSASNDDYLVCSISYDVKKVTKYINRIQKVLADCEQKQILNIDFELCLGQRKHILNGNIESFYLASIPTDNNNIRLNNYFPFYDQGSLEP
ncbi:hypothetical protein, partial [uncultured Chryseobacterium sp.]